MSHGTMELTTYKMMCTQQRLRSACASAQPDQGLHCPHEEASFHCPREEVLGPQLSIECLAKNDQTADLIWAAAWQNQRNNLCAQQRLRSAWASAQSDESSLSAWRNIGPLTTYWAHSEDSDQTGQMPRSMGAQSFCWFCRETAQTSFWKFCCALAHEFKDQFPLWTS